MRYKAIRRHIFFIVLIDRHGVGEKERDFRSHGNWMDTTGFFCFDLLQTKKMTTSDEDRTDVPPEHWGRAMWTTLFACLEGISENESIAWEEWILLLLPSLLPCGRCRQHYSEYVRNHPFPLWETTKESSVSFSEWKEQARSWLVILQEVIRQDKRKREVDRSPPAPSPPPPGLLPVKIKGPRPGPIPQRNRLMVYSPRAYPHPSSLLIQPTSCCGKKSG